MNLEMVLKYISENNLDTPNRGQENVYRRHYLCAKLYETNELTLARIGNIFNRHYSSVIYSNKKHKELSKDKIYLKIIEDCANMLDDAQFSYTSKSRDIFKDVSKANNLDKIRRIKKWIKEGKYDQNVCTFVSDRAADTVETDQKVGE